MILPPFAVDLCCGRGGATRALLAAGYYVIGTDIIRHPEYPIEAAFIHGDIRELDARLFAGALLMWASPPCQEFSRHDQPWTRAKNPPEPDMSIVDACYRIRDQAHPNFFILENVRGAQKWLGRANFQRAGRYLWGDALLAPRVPARQKQSFPGSRPDLRAEVPFELVRSIASMIREGVRCFGKRSSRRR